VDKGGVLYDTRNNISQQQARRVKRGRRIGRTGVVLTSSVLLCLAQDMHAIEQLISTSGLRVSSV